MPKLRKFFRCRSGATAVEYALIIGAIGLALAAGTQAFSAGFKTMGTTIINTLKE